MILDVLATGPRNAMKISGALRERGDTTADAQIVIAILGQMVRSGDVVQQEGDCYARNPKAIAMGARRAG